MQILLSLTLVVAVPRWQHHKQLNLTFSLLPITSSHPHASASDPTFDFWRYINIWLTLTFKHFSFAITVTINDCHWFVSAVRRTRWRSWPRIWCEQDATWRSSSWCERTFKPWHSRYKRSSRTTRWRKPWRVSLRPWQQWTNRSGLTLPYLRGGHVVTPAQCWGRIRSGSDMNFCLRVLLSF